MGLKEDNQTTYKLNEEVASYFTIVMENTIKNNNYENLKNNIFQLDIDSEEKAQIINAINKLNKTKSLKEQKELTKKIENFKKKYKL